MAPFDQASSIMNIVLSKSDDRIRTNESIILNLSFRIEGQIREVFEQHNWEKAYNKHDNLFRLTTNVDLRSNRKVITSLKFVRKAILFWTRSPKIHHRIWVMVVKDDNSFYPSTVDEAKALLFDIDRVIELDVNDLKPGKHSLVADISVSWGKHLFSKPCKLQARSDKLQFSLEQTS
jgi:hypothetical protein